MKYNNIYDFVKEQEVAYQKEIELESGWDWSMKDHIKRCFLYKNSQFFEENEDRDLRPNKNIILAILNIQYRTEGFDVKDIELYVNNPENYYKSFFVKKFHEKWVLENEIDTFIDDVVESYADYGGALVRDTDSNRPEVIDLRSLAFCNQTNILNYPFCIKHKLSPSQLREMDKWGEESYGATIDIESLILLAKKEKDNENKEITIYELHGIMPSEWLGTEEEKKDIPQINIVAFYKKQDGNEQGVTLFKHKEPKLPFKFLPRDKIVGRALGRSGIEELFESQQWTNWNEIKITEMLDAASKIIFKSSDPNIKGKHPSGLKDLDNLEIIDIQQGQDIAQLDTTPRSLAVFNDAIVRWQNHAQQLGAASEGMLGEAPASGTPFKLFEAQTIEAKSMHRYRQGQIAVFMDEIYRDWILPHIAKEIVNEQTFLSELSVDEMQKVADSLLINEANKYIKNRILNGEIVEEMEVEIYKDKVRNDFVKSNKKFLILLKNEMKDIPLTVNVSIAGKQKNLSLMTDKLTNLIRQVIATPQILQDPYMQKLLNVILESSGLSPMLFGSRITSQVPQLPQGSLQRGSTEPLKEFGKSVKEEALTL